MRRFLSEEELWPKGFDPAIRHPGEPAWPPAWNNHSTGVATWDRVGPIEKYCDARSAEELIRVIGTGHGEYVRERVERERRGAPDGAAAGNRRCWGNMLWRLNDSWPMIYGSVVDYYLEPKIAYYFTRRAYAPVLVSFEKTADRIHVWVINDSSQPVRGTLVVERLGFDGAKYGALRREVIVVPGESKRCGDATELGEISLRSQFLRAMLADQEATLLLTDERYLHLPAVHLQVRRETDGLIIATDRFARQVTLEIPDGDGAVFDDNYFDLVPGQSRTIRVIRAGGGGQVSVSALNAERVTQAGR